MEETSDGNTWRKRTEKENLSPVWVNRAIWPSIIRDADDWRPVIEIPKANIDSSWSRRSFGLWHTSLLHYFLPLPSIQVEQMDYSGWGKKKNPCKDQNERKRRNIKWWEKNDREREKNRKSERRLIKGILGMRESKTQLVPLTKCMMLSFGEK